MKQVDVIGIGSAFVDYFFDVDEEFLQSINLRPQHSRDITDEAFTKTFSSLPLLAKSSGGSTPLTLAVLEKLGIHTAYAGVIGNDDDGKFWRNSLSKIDKHLKIFGNTPRSACLLSNERKDRSFLYTLNEKEHSFFDKVDYKLLNSSQFLHITPFYTDYKRSFEYLVKMVKYIDEPKISFCPALVYTSLGLKTLQPFLKKTEIIFFSKEELLLIYSDVKKGSKELLMYGPKIVVCTLGAEGVLVTTSHQQFITKGKRVIEIIDTTGAGDAFAAGFLYGLLKNNSLEWSADFANMIAAKAITDFGLQWLERFDKEKFIK